MAIEYSSTILSKVMYEFYELVWTNAFIYACSIIFCKCLSFSSLMSLFFIVGQNVMTGVEKIGFILMMAFLFMIYCQENFHLH